MANSYLKVKDSWEDDEDIIDIAQNLSIGIEDSTYATERKRQEALVMKSDLEVSCDLFGVSKPKEEPKVLSVTSIPKVVTSKPVESNDLSLQNIKLLTKEDFDHFSGQLVPSLTRFDESKFYVPFLESITVKLAANLTPADMKRIATALTNAANAKQKKITESQGKNKKKSLYVGKANARAIPDDFADDDFSDDYD